MIALTLMLLLSALDEPQAKPAPPAAPAQDPDRPTIAAAELKALRDTNIFSPRSAKRVKPATPTFTRRDPPAPVKPKAPMMTGIFFDVASQAHLAIVEDKNDAAHKFFKEPKFMKAGDEWAGIKLESVTQDKAVFNKGGTTKDVHIGESLPDSEEKPLGAADGGDEVFPEDGELPPADSATGAPPATRKSPVRSRTESKSMTPESQSRTLEEMKKRVKKNRPSDPEE